MAAGLGPFSGAASLPSSSVPGLLSIWMFQSAMADGICEIQIHAEYCVAQDG